MNDYTPPQRYLAKWDCYVPIPWVASYEHEAKDEQVYRRSLKVARHMDDRGTYLRFAPSKTEVTDYVIIDGEQIVLQSPPTNRVGKPYLQASHPGRQIFGRLHSRCFICGDYTSPITNWVDSKNPQLGTCWGPICNHCHPNHVLYNLLFGSSLWQTKHGEGVIIGFKGHSYNVKSNNGSSYSISPGSPVEPTDIPFVSSFEASHRPFVAQEAIIALKQA